jgi:hypothetical protein
MNFEVESILETMVKTQVNKMVGEKDVNFNTIVKMALLQDIAKSNIDSDAILAKIKENNEMEKYLLEKEFFLTYDNAGNIIEIPNIPNDQTRQSENQPSTDSSSIVSKPE